MCHGRSCPAVRCGFTLPLSRRPKVAGRSPGRRVFMYRGGLELPLWRDRVGLNIGADKMLRELMGKPPLVKGENLSLALAAIVAKARETDGEGRIGFLEIVSWMRENARVSHKDAMASVLEVVTLLGHLSLVGELGENLCFQFTDLGREVLAEVWEQNDAFDISSPEAQKAWGQVSRMLR